MSRKLWDALLLPRGVGPAPWTNPRYRSLAYTLDTWAFRFVVLNNCLGLYAIFRRFPLLHMVRESLPAAAMVTAAALQLVARRRWPDYYYRHRHYILAFQRLCRVPIIAHLPLTARRWIRNSQIQAAVSGFTAAEPSSKTLAAVGCLMALSGAMHTLTHVAAVPLPFLPQLFFQSVYLAILLVFQAAPCAAFLDLAPCKPQLQRACHALNGILVVVASAHSGVILHVEGPARICDDHTSLQMMLFVQLYFCFVVPLYYAYRLELECSLHLQQHHPPLPPAPAARGGLEVLDAPPPAPTSVALAGDLMVLLCLVMVCWLLALAALPHLPTIMLPLGAPL